MIHILVTVSMADLPTFLGTFSTRGALLRQQHGSKGSTVFQVQEQDGKALILFQWESKAAFEGFLSDPDVRESMKTSGTMGPPEITFLTELAQFPS